MAVHNIYIASCVENGGIFHYKLQNSALTFVDKTNCDMPMYLCIEDKVLYACLKAPFKGSLNSGLQAFEINGDASIGKAGAVTSTNGEVACHLCRFNGETFIANYISGSVTSDKGKKVIHSGVGVDKVRQNAPHTHFVYPSPDNSQLFVTDLGLDAIYSYNSSLHCKRIAKVPEGHGARHLAYSTDGEYVFCANELASTVTVFKYENECMQELQTVSVLTHKIKSTVAAIRVYKNYVYVSNRGDDSISCLLWNKEKLSLCNCVASGGKSPRDFFIVENVLFCANEQSDNVTIFDVDGAALTQRAQSIKMKVPLCVISTQGEN